MKSITGVNSKIMLEIFHMILWAVVGAIVLVVVHQYHSIEISSVHLFSFYLLIIMLALLAYKGVLINKEHQHYSIIKFILNSIPDVIAVKDWQGRFIFCNQAVADLYNTEPEHMLGKTAEDFIGERVQGSDCQKHIQPVMDGFEPTEVFELSTDLNTGKTRYFQSVKVPYRNVKGRLGVVELAKDVSEITLLKEESEKNKRRLEHVLDVSQEGLWEWNVVTNEVFYNQQWMKITGIYEQQNTYSSFSDAIVPEDRERVKKAMRELVEKHKSLNIKFRMVRPDGQIIWLWDRGQIVEHGESGEPVWVSGIVQDVTFEMRSKEKVEKLAYYDPLTNLPNRTLLNYKLDTAIRESRSLQLYSAVFFLGVDRFKLLNDTYGHHVGDQLLKNIASRLQSLTSEGLFVSRFSGDEFVVILPLIHSKEDCALTRTEQFCNNLIQQFSKDFTLSIDSQNTQIEYSVTTSIGSVVFKDMYGDLSSGLSSLLKLADTALNRAKAGGGNESVILDDSMQLELNHEGELRKSLWLAVRNREFVIHLQPKYNVNKKIIGAEALARWRHPERGMLYPASFLGLLEETNLIVPVGRQVLELACQQLKCWQNSEQYSALKIAVNISAKQIRQADFVSRVIRIIERNEVKPEGLILEVTETVLLQDIDDAIDKLRQLTEYGVAISLDDFGTGYSSLSYLRSLPIDELKIDRSFVQDITSDNSSLTMVNSIVHLARNFDLNIVTEGVETEEQYRLLDGLNVDVFQGYYFSKPVSVQKFSALLEAEHISAELMLQE